MAERWVLNASPVICLERAGLGYLLMALTEEVRVPQAVADEIAAGPEGDPAIQAMASGQFKVVNVEPAPEILAWDLGRGETAVLSYALMNPDWTVILDDRAARKCAMSFSIPHKGTLAVVILAKKREIIPSAATALRALKSAGLRLEDDVIRAALLRTVGEEW